MIKWPDVLVWHSFSEETDRGGQLEKYLMSAAENTQKSYFVEDENEHHIQVFMWLGESCNPPAL